MIAGEQVYRRVVDKARRGALRTQEHVVIEADAQLGSLAVIAFCARARSELQLASVRVRVTHDGSERGVDDAADVAIFARNCNLDVTVIEHEPRPHTSRKNAPPETPSQRATGVVVTGETIEDAARVVWAELLRGHGPLRGLVERRRDGRVRPLLGCTLFELGQMLQWMELEPLVQLEPEARSPQEVRLHNSLRAVSAFEPEAQRILAELPSRIRAMRRK